MDPGAAGGAGPGARASPARARLTADGGAGGLGVSFSPRRARAQGLDWREAFQGLLALGLSPLRLSAFWEDIDESGYAELDWLLDAAADAGREAVVTVGMKAQGWPEFSIPRRLLPDARRGSDVSLAGPALRAGALDVARATVERYRRHPAVVAWQVENEPLNPSGPRRWWIGPEFLRQEIGAVRSLDPVRPIVLNVFAGFNAWLDVVSSRHGVRRLLPCEGLRPEAEALTLLRPGDILGLDVYRRIGYRRAGRPAVTSSRRWRRNAARWLARASAEGKRAWIVEAQAEPWEPGLAPGDTPSSCRPDDVVETVTALRGAGYDTVLLWGVEYWLARAAGGDTSWMDAAQRLLAAT